jgi:hypothetical protein
MIRSDIVTRARDYLYESTANIFSADQLNRLFIEELRSLGAKDVYLEDIWDITTVIDQQEYLIPSGTVKIERLERNDGTTAKPSWVEINGWDNYGGYLYLPFNPTDVESYRAFIKKQFTEVADDTTALDIPVDKSELLVWGIVVRAYKMLIGYFRGSQSWDSVTKPGDISMTSIQAWLRDAKTEYKELLQNYATTPRPRDINLTS